MEERIDGLTLAETKYNIYAFGRDMRNFARKVERARLDHTRAKWQRKYANAKGYLEDNQKRLACFEAVEHSVQRTCANCGADDWVSAGFPVTKCYCRNCGASR